MASNFPGGLDNLNRPDLTHGDVTDALTAVETTVAVLRSGATDVLTTAGEVVPNRSLIMNNVFTASGVVHLTYFTAAKSETISTLTVSTGATAAAATPTLCRLGLYTENAAGNLTLVASTANDTTLFSAINTPYSKALTTPYAKVVGQRYATAVIVISTNTMPMLHGTQLNATQWLNNLARLSPAISGRVSGQTDLPASVAAGSIIGYQALFGMLLS